MSTSRHIPDTLHKPNQSHAEWLLRRIWDRVNRHNEHFMFVIVGQEGLGKSYTAIKMAHAVDPSFNADRVIFDVTDLLKTLKDGDHESGQFYVLDEAGVQLGRRTWQERGQVLANQALQLVRNHNLGLIFTLPRLSELDSQTQGRLQGFFEIVEKEPEQYVTGKLKFFDPDRADETGKIYKKYPRRRINGQLARIERFSFTPPDSEIVEPYEERKQSFQEEFYQKTIDKLEEADEDGEDEFSAKELAIQIVEDENVDVFTSVHNGNGRQYINKDMLKDEFDLTESQASAVKGYLESLA